MKKIFDLEYFHFILKSKQDSPNYYKILIFINNTCIFENTFIHANSNILYDIYNQIDYLFNEFKGEIQREMRKLLNIIDYYTTNNIEIDYIKNCKN